MHREIQFLLRWNKSINSAKTYEIRCQLKVLDYLPVVYGQSARKYESYHKHVIYQKCNMAYYTVFNKWNKLQLLLFEKQHLNKITLKKLNFS